MVLTPKEIISLVTPPLFIHLAKLLQKNQYGLSGDHRDWAEAIAASTGYDSDIILELTTAALMKVKNGDAVYERDSVLFDEIQYSWPLLAGLMWVAARYEGRLNVLDFGGSLGSTFYQNLAFLSDLPMVRWNIVEQSSHVKIGKEYFEDHNLRFYTCIEECLTDTKPNVLLLSSVLQYLEHPDILFNQMLKLPCGYIIIDRTPYWAGPTDRLCVQTVPPSIYPGSYPSWIFSRSRFHSNIPDDWHIIVTFDNSDKLAGPVDFAYQGVIIARNNYVS